jgi:hypothetical protein
MVTLNNFVDGSVVVLLFSITQEDEEVKNYPGILGQK